MNYWFTSDWHLSHYNIMKYAHRPFSSVEEMDSTIIDRFHNSIKPGDQVYFLGDLSFNKEVVEVFFRYNIPRNIHFHYIIGNHDRHILKMAKEYCDSVSQIKDIKIEKQKITLCHNPMITWNCSHWGAWQLFGHHHSNIIYEKFPGKIMNVGVDVNNFYPVNFCQVRDFMHNQPDNWDLIKEGKTKKHEKT